MVETPSMSPRSLAALLFLIGGPRAIASPPSAEPGEELSGGTTTVVQNGQNAFSLPLANISTLIPVRAATSVTAVVPSPAKMEALGYFFVSVFPGRRSRKVMSRSTLPRSPIRSTEGNSESSPFPAPNRKALSRSTTRKSKVSLQTDPPTPFGVQSTNSFLRNRILLPRPIS